MKPDKHDRRSLKRMKRKYKDFSRGSVLAFNLQMKNISKELKKVLNKK